jgi:pimeloyl-ACP methyl ester carboxylesterase
MRWIATGLVLLTVAYCALLILVFVMQRTLLFPRPRDGRLPSAPEALVRIPGPDRTTVFALYARAQAGQPTVVHFHGNAEQLADQEDMLGEYRRHGLGFMAVEYPGYGLAGGQTPSETAIFAAADAALRYLVESLAVPRETIILEGRSLGSGPAIEMAARGWGVGLVLVSPYTSIVDLGAQTFPFLPARLLVRDPFDNASKAPRIQMPVLIIHGSNDEVIPFEMGRKLAGLFPHARFETVAGAGHNDVLAGPSPPLPLGEGRGEGTARLFDEILRFAVAASGGRQGER